MSELLLLVVGEVYYLRFFELLNFTTKQMYPTTEKIMLLYKQKPCISSQINGDKNIV